MGENIYKRPGHGGQYVVGKSSTGCGRHCSIEMAEWLERHGIKWNPGGGGWVDGWMEEWMDTSMGA